MPKGKTTGGNTTTKTSGNITNVRKGKPGQTQQENVVTNEAVATTTGNAIEGTGSFAPGPWESGKQGKWEQGAVGQWKSQPAPGPWESGTKVGKWEAGAVGQWKTGGGKTGEGSRGTPNVRPRDLIEGTHPGPFRDGRSLVYDGSASDGTTPLDDNGALGGGGGTGNPLAGVASALKSTNIKTTEQLAGKSVEESIKGARRTRKTGGVRTQ